MLPEYAELFRDTGEAEIDELMRSFRLRDLRTAPQLAAILSEYSRASLPADTA